MKAITEKGPCLVCRGWWQLRASEGVGRALAFNCFFFGLNEHLWWPLDIWGHYLAPTWKNVLIPNDILIICFTIHYFFPCNFRLWSGDATFQVTYIVMPSNILAKNKWDQVPTIVKSCDKPLRKTYSTLKKPTIFTTTIKNEKKPRSSKLSSLTTTNTSTVLLLILFHHNKNQKSQQQ